MRIHTDTLTMQDLFNALPPQCQLVGVTMHGSRTHAYAFECALSGTDTHRTQSSAAYGMLAATWQEWGVWLASLFELDPSMRAAHYANASDFYMQTAKANELDPIRYAAPWLE